jgi:hypothetical protein
MRVLATNCSLRGRSGTEIVTIDLALGLRSRGHEVAVFAPLLEKSAEILRDQGISPDQVAMAGALIGGASSIGLMSVVNFVIGSDFKWALFACALVWALSLIAYGFEATPQPPRSRNTRQWPH